MTSHAAPDVGAIARDPDAFEVFYREHLETVQRFVARRIADPHLAADLTAEVFLAAVDSAASYRPDPGGARRLARGCRPQRPVERVPATVARPRRPASHQRPTAS